MIRSSHVNSLPIWHRVTSKWAQTAFWTGYGSSHRASRQWAGWLTSSTYHLLDVCLGAHISECVSLSLLLHCKMGTVIPALVVVRACHTVGLLGTILWLISIPSWRQKGDNTTYPTGHSFALILWEGQLKVTHQRRMEKCLWSQCRGIGFKIKRPGFGMNCATVPSAAWLLRSHLTFITCYIG